MNWFSQDEANPDTYVPFAGDELRLIQENGDIREHPRPAFLRFILRAETSEPNLPQKER
jgi:hypothetical protein